MNKSTTMKNSIKIAFLFAAFGLPCTAFAAYAGFAAPAAFNGEIAFSLLAIAGLQLVALFDGRRNRAAAPQRAAAARLAAVACPSRRSYGLQRRRCVAA